MYFAHLVQVNDPADSTLAPLSRAELWRALELRVERPQLFVYGLDACRILARGAGQVERELRFGRLRVRDRVRLQPPDSVWFEVEASEEVPGGSLAMTIEEPRPGYLFVRFEYQVDVAGGAGVEDPASRQARESAYFAADIDTVATARRLAAAGLLTSTGSSTVNRSGT